MRRTQGSSIGNSYNFIIIIFFFFFLTVIRPAKILNSTIKAVSKAEHSLPVRLVTRETQMGRTGSKKVTERCQGRSMIPQVISQ